MLDRPSNGGPFVRRATEADLDAVSRVVNWAIEHTSANFHTEPQSVDDWRDRFRGEADRYPWLVSESNAGVSGVAMASSHSDRGAYAWTAAVAVYIDPAWHGRGHGRSLYRRLLPILEQQGFHTLLAGITLPNPASVALHESFGFEATGSQQRLGRKFGAWHDVGTWQRHLQSADHEPGPLEPVAEALRKLEEETR